MELIVYAPIWGQSGFEQLSRGLFLALDQMGVQIELRPAEDWNSERVGLPQDVVNRLTRMTNTRVCELAPHVIYQLPRGQAAHKDAPKICYTLFETDRCPKPWVDALNRMDRVFVFSEFNRKSWSKSGIKEEKIRSLPPAVDSFVYTPTGPRYQITDSKGFTFLLSGDFTERKNFEAVLEAYTKEFDGDEAVTLIVKGHYGGFIKRHRRDCLEKLQNISKAFAGKNPPRILFWGDKISDQAMAALYRSVDCFVLTSRGEGLGMQYLEAMATGIPVIACDWGAQTDFLNQENSYPVASSLNWIDDPNYIAKCLQALNSKWCQVHIGDLQNAMRHVVSNYGEAQEKADIALEWVRTQTWQGMAIEFIRHVLELYGPISEVVKEREEVFV